VKESEGGSAGDKAVVERVSGDEGGSNRG